MKKILLFAALLASSAQANKNSSISFSARVGSAHAFVDPKVEKSYDLNANLAPDSVLDRNNETVEAYRFSKMEGQWGGFGFAGGGEIGYNFRNGSHVMGIHVGYGGSTHETKLKIPTVGVGMFLSPSQDATIKVLAEFNAGLKYSHFISEKMSAGVRVDYIGKWLNFKFDQVGFELDESSSPVYDNGTKVITSVDKDEKWNHGVLFGACFNAYLNSQFSIGIQLQHSITFADFDLNDTKLVGAVIGKGDSSSNTEYESIPAGLSLSPRIHESRMGLNLTYHYSLCGPKTSA